MTHWVAVKRIVYYLKGTIIHGLLIRPGFIGLLHGFFDVDWNSNPDDRRSISGFAIFLGLNIISWSSKK